MEENANKLHLCTSFNFSTRVTVYAECIYMLTEYLKYEAYTVRRHSYFLFTARFAAAWQPVNSCVLQLFQQLISTTLCAAFLRTFLCQPLCCVSLQIQTFYQNLVLVAEYHVDC